MHNPNTNIRYNLFVFLAMLKGEKNSTFSGMEFLPTFNKVF